MDFYKFINSCDIREHLRTMKYVFNAKEAVWLIYYSHEATVKERMEACRYIVENMPDVSLGSATSTLIGSFFVPDKKEESERKGEVVDDTVKYDTAHQLARDYADLLEHYINVFDESEEGALYSYQYYIENGSYWSEEYDSSYSSLQKCKETLKEDLDDEKPLSYSIKKHWIDHEKPSIIMYYDSNDELKDIEYPWDDKVSSLNYCFEGLGFNFPTPFKKGDVLVAKSYRLPEEDPCLIVMEDIAAWTDEDENKSMIVIGCFQNDDGSIVQDHTTSPFTDFELYKGVYVGKTRIMKLISDYIKGNAGLEELLCFYRKYDFK